MSDDNSKKYSVAKKRRILKEDAEHREQHRSEMHLTHVPADCNIPFPRDDRDAANDDLAANRVTSDDDSTSWEDLDEFCSVDDLTEIIPVDRKTIYNMINDGELPGAKRFGRKILLHTDTVYNWVTG